MAIGVIVAYLTESDQSGQTDATRRRARCQVGLLFSFYLLTNHFKVFVIRFVV